MMTNCRYRRRASQKVLPRYFDFIAAAAAAFRRRAITASHAMLSIPCWRDG
jgi:hypothetical protein